MQEYRDGTFGDVQEGSDLLKKLASDEKELSRTKAVHFGERDELEAMKLNGTNAKQIKAKVDQLERKINRIMIHLGIQTPGEILVVD